MITAMNQPVTIPVAFLDEAPLRALAVNDEGLLKLLSLDDGRSRSAAMQASWKFRTRHGIRTLPGGTYSIYEIQNALRRAADKQFAGLPK